LTTPATPHVGEWTTLFVTVVNQGPVAGSPRLEVWLWPAGYHYGQEPLPAGTKGLPRPSTLDPLGPGDSHTYSWSWTPHEAVADGRLQAGGQVLPYAVLDAAPAGQAAPPEGEGSDGAPAPDDAP
jgi:hypothetical protein